ncbi:MAG: hypothetical protein ACTSU2_08560 [Promethearchaeota archaeon]
MIYKRKVSSLILIGMMLFSVVIPFIVSAQTPSSYTYLDYKSGEDTYFYNWTESENSWSFGPKTHFDIYYENGTMLDRKTGYIEIDQLYIWRIAIPDRLIDESSGDNISYAEVHGYTYRLYFYYDEQGNFKMGAEDWNLNMQFTREYSEEDGKEYTHFTSVQYVINDTSNHFSGQSMDPIENPDLPIENITFFELDEQKSEVYHDTVHNFWVIDFYGKFNNKVLHAGYTFSYSASSKNGVQFSSWTQDMFNYDYYMNPESSSQLFFGVGEYIPYYGWSQQGSMWSFKKYSQDGEEINTISINEPWSLRFNISKQVNFTNGAYTLFVLSLPNGYNNYSIRTGYHMEKVIHYGGWQWDPNQHTYIWNDSAQIEAQEEVYGNYTTQHWVSSSISHNHEVNVTGYFWDDSNNAIIYTTRTMYVYDQLYLIYNTTTHTFEEKIGYEYEAYTDPDGSNKKYYVFRDPDPSEPTENIYHLIKSNCSYYKDAFGDYIVEYTGYFTKYMYDPSEFSRNEIYFSVGVYNREGSEYSWGNYYDDSNIMQCRINLETPVAKTYIVEDGRLFSASKYPIKVNKSFIIRSRLEGSRAFWDNVSAITIRMSGYDWHNYGTYDTSSNYEINALYDLGLKQQSMNIYNRTEKHEKVYGIYWDWVTVTKTGFHWEYNSKTGGYDWVNGTYEVQEYRKLAGYHWETYTYNFKTQSWTKECSPLHSAETKVENTSDTITIYNVTKYLKNNVYYMDINLSLGSNLATTIYNWYLIFNHKEYGYDENQVDSEYNVSIWAKENILYYLNGNSKVYSSNLQDVQYVDLDLTGTNHSYVLYNLPYLDLDGTKLPLKIARMVDSMGYKYENILYKLWNNSKNDYNLYYRTANTWEKIPVSTNYSVNVYTVDIGGNLTLKTFMRGTYEYYNQSLQKSQYKIIDIYGHEYLVNEPMEWNTTGGDQYFDSYSHRWENFASIGNRNITNVETFDLTNEIKSNLDPYRSGSDAHYFINVEGERLEVMSDSFQWGYWGGYYISLINGDLITLYYYNDPQVNVSLNASEGEVYHASYVAYIDGEWKWVSNSIWKTYPINYYGETIYVPINLESILCTNIANIINKKYYVTWNGSQYVIPRIDSISATEDEIRNPIYGLWKGRIKECGLIPEDKIIWDGDTYYTLENITKINGTEYCDIYINSTTSYKDVPIKNTTIVVINNTNYFNVSEQGYKVEYGLLDAQDPSYEYIHFQDALFIKKDQYLLRDKYDIEATNMSNYYPNGTYYLEDFDGHIYNIEKVTKLPIYQVNIYENQEWNNSYHRLLVQNVSLFSINPDWVEHSQLYPALNGTWLNFSSDMNIDIVVLNTSFIKADCHALHENSTYNSTVYNFTTYYLYDFNWTWESVVHSVSEFEYNDSQGYFHTYGYGAKLFWRFELNGTYYYLETPYFWYDIEQNKYITNNWEIIYQVDINGTNYTLYPENTYILKVGETIGKPYGYFNLPLDVSEISTTSKFIVGLPDHDLWGFRLWTITDNGALDLDGNLSTTDDQFYVFRKYYSENNESHYRKYLDVYISLDPDTTRSLNSFDLKSSMAYNVMEWNYNWQDTYTWYYANNFSLIDSNKMNEIRSKIWNTYNNLPIAGYWDIGVMAINRSSANILNDAKNRDWWWMHSNHQNWTWLEFNVDQQYWADFYNNDSSYVRSALIRMRQEFAGIMLYNDSNNNGFMDIGNNEITHFFIPSGVQNVSFILPTVTNGIALNSSYLSSFGIKGNGTLYSGAAKINWGIKFEGINGTTYPYNGQTIGLSMWDWYNTYISGFDTNTFASKPEPVSIDTLFFGIHFNAVPINNGTNYRADIKIDQEVGNWDCYDIGGRNNFENYSMSLSYYIHSIAYDMSNVTEKDFEQLIPDFNTAGTPEPTPQSATTSLPDAAQDDNNTSDQGDGDQGVGDQDDGDQGSGNSNVGVLDSKNQTVDPFAQTRSDRFSLIESQANGVFARCEMGSPYTWDYNKSMPLNVSAFTIPLNVFRAIYMGDQDSSATSFKISDNMYFMSQGFKYWNGFAVFNDPTFTSFVGTNEHHFVDLNILHNPVFWIAIVGGAIGCLTITVYIIKRKRNKEQKLNQLQQEIIS